jgi:hypothetical protein
MSSAAPSLVPEVQPSKAEPKKKSGASSGRMALDVIGRLLWIGVMASGGFAALNFVTTYLANSTSISAPQLAALAAETLVFAITPYVLARGWDEATRPAPKA